MAVLGSHIDDGNFDVSELAALYLHIYERASNQSGVQHRNDMLSLLREELVAAQGALQDEVVSALIVRAASESYRHPAFFAALDLASEGDCANRLPPGPTVSLYLDVILATGERFGDPQLRADDARTLVVLALRCDDAVRRRFFSGDEIASQLRAGPSDESETFTFPMEMARRVRLHMRVLARAISAWQGDVPAEIVQALLNIVRTGTTSDASQGRVDAFRFDFSFEARTGDRERPLAQDLAPVFRRMDAPQRQQLVAELYQVTEPAVLAGLVVSTPPDVHTLFKTKLSTMTPENSPHAWPAVVQARVEALLSAGLVDLADTFAQAGRATNHGAGLPGADVADVRTQLRTMFAREDWTGIASFQVPSTLSVSDRREASEVLQFYRSLAEIVNPSGNPAAAEGILLTLVEHEARNVAYRTNLFAARVRRLTAADSFGLLSGAALSEAKRFLSEAERDVRPLLVTSPLELKAFESNRSLLLLACGRNHDCLRVILGLPEGDVDVRIEGFRALALARLGSKSEAFVLLTQAARRYGTNEFLSAVHDNIDSHRPFVVRPGVALDDDPVPGIRHAFEAFRGLGYLKQVEAIDPHGRLDNYLLDQVRGACGSVVSLATSMRALQMDTREDHISLVIKQMLVSRFLPVQWTVEDQSQGGATALLNYGERDLAIKKDSATLAILEALVVNHVETGELRAHFLKLFSYDTCVHFFHLTYARSLNGEALLAFLKSTCMSPSPGVTYARQEPLDDTSSLPVGFKAFYTAGHRNFTVTFLVLEFGLELHRTAAAAAAGR